PDAILLAGSMGARIHDNTALLATFRSTLESSHMGFADNLSILEPALGAESAVRGAILRVLSERLVPWARRRLAAASTPATSAARSAKDDRRGDRRLLDSPGPQIRRRSVSKTKNQG